MGSINKWIGVGRLGKDIELRSTQNGLSVTSFSIACDRNYSKGESGHADTDWIDCQAWKNTAEYLNNYAHKGDRIAVEGHLQKRSYKDHDDRMVYVMEVIVERVVIMSAASSSKSSSYSTGAYSEPSYRASEDEHTDGHQSESNQDVNKTDFGLDISADDLPF